MESWAALVSVEYDRRLEHSDYAVDEGHAAQSRLTDLGRRPGPSVSAHNFGHDSRSGHRFPELIPVSKLFKKLKDKIDDVAYYLIF
jgi:hypothetical protein